MTLDWIVGKVVSKNSGIYYEVKFDMRAKAAFVRTGERAWRMLEEEVINEKEALKSAERFVDSQPLY